MSTLPFARPSVPKLISIASQSSCWWMDMVAMLRLSGFIGKSVLRADDRTRASSSTGMNPVIAPRDVTALRCKDDQPPYGVFGPIARCPHEARWSPSGSSAFSRRFIGPGVPSERVPRLHANSSDEVHVTSRFPLASHFAASRISDSGSVRQDRVLSALTRKTPISGRLGIRIGTARRCPSQSHRQR